MGCYAAASYPDKAPSLQIYPATNTYYRCFLSNCNGGTGEAIVFIELIAKCTKHMAIIKAQSMTGLPELKSAPQISGHNSKSTDPMALAKLMAREAVLSKLFKYLLKALPLPKKEWIIREEEPLITSSMKRVIVAVTGTIN